MPAVRVVVTGAAGQIGYSILPLIARGDMLGPDTPIELHLLEVPSMLQALEGIHAELMDCVFPLLQKVILTSDPHVAFQGAEVAVLLASVPPENDTCRKDFMQFNSKMHYEQGSVLGEVGAPDCRVLVVSNPANTNALTLLKGAKGKLNPRHVTAMTRLDHNRGLYQMSQRASVPLSQVKNVTIWGNHSSTQVPDVNSATINGLPAREAVRDDAFWDDEFVSRVQKRGYDVLSLRGMSSALSAAKSAVDHVRDWILGTPEGTHVSMAVDSTGNPYGIPDGLIFSFPCTCREGEWSIVSGCPVSPAVAKLLQVTTKELIEEDAEAMRKVGSD